MLLLTLLPLLTMSFSSSPIRSYTFKSRDDYAAHLKTVSNLPQGFLIGSASTTFNPIEAPNLRDLPIRLTLIALESPSKNWAAVFTKNAFPGAPVVVGKALRAKPDASLAAIVVNNKVSNVCAGGGVGVSDAEAIADSVKATLGVEDGEVLPCSTGVIGWRVPREELIAAVPTAVSGLQGDSILEAAESIMTTDRFPKVSERVLSNGARISGIVKVRQKLRVFYSNQTAVGRLTPPTSTTRKNTNPDHKHAKKHRALG